MRLIILSGLSGSGKSVALHMLEDLGYYCIDNIPAGLLRSFVSQTVQTNDPAFEQMAVGMDARNRHEDIRTVPTLVDELRQSGVECDVIFLHADDAILLKRYGETRRKHPLTGARQGLREAIARERELLGPVTDSADLIIDTTRTSVHDLREAVRQRVGTTEAGELSLLLQSFGFKHGIPSDADFVFDARCLPNPFWEPTLRAFTGRDQPVVEFLETQAVVSRMLGDIIGFLERWIPEYSEANRHYLTVAVGCTGGQHRSVYLIERIAAHFASAYPQLLIRHNELPSDTTHTAGD